MKDQKARARDIERAWEQLAERVADTPGVTSRGEFAGGLAYRVRRLGMAALTVIIEPEIHDGELWLHLSVSTAGRVPSWDEMRWCRDVFIGDRKAISVLPVSAEYVNIHPNCLHLFAPLERDPLPDFRRVCPVVGGLSL